jgi:daunorubicin resistance ABC transporter ATP-binding subunit
MSDPRLEAVVPLDDASPGATAAERWMVDAADAAVVFAAVRKQYRGTTALDGLDLVVGRGEIFGLLGPNGSGKTTTVNLLCGLLAPTSGAIAVLGHDVARDPAAVRPLLGVVPQETALYGELSAERNLRFHAELYGVPRKQRAQRVREMLELVDLWDRRSQPVKTFSGGMRRRLAIARAMLHRPAILYLDEPTLGVDVPSRRAVWSHIRHLRRDGTTVLLTTNYLEEASELCDRIAILNHGRAVALGTPKSLRRRIGGSVLELALTRIPPAGLLEQLRSIDGVVAVELTGERLAVSYTEGDETAARVVNAVTERCQLRQMSQRDSSLDEVFLRLTGGPDDGR